MRISVSDFYTKYCLIKNADGSYSAPKLTEKEKMMFDTAEELGVDPFVIRHGRGMTTYDTHPLIIEHLQKKGVKL